jgi:hypothetical protein
MFRKLALCLGLFLFGCQTTVKKAEFETRMDRVEYQLAFQYYNNLVDLCLVQGELCKLNNKNSCRALTERCVIAVNEQWKMVKKSRGWK